MHSRIYDVLPTTSTVSPFLTFHAPEGPPGRQQEAPQEPPKTPRESTYQTCVLIFQFLISYFSVLFFKFLIVFSCPCKQPQDPPPRSPHPGGPRRHPEEAPGGPPRNCQEEAPRRPGRTSYVHDMCGAMCGYSPGPGRTYLLSVLSTVLRVLRVFNTLNTFNTVEHS